ncbi:ShlB/FhaC/HecB family hemolysin secretion/activation protein [Nitrosovibrio sp. Nv17]|uniref:ShlB/FhaC/HecB family hemolysin secretion/activation protein n=1 Tax=Nitrosovibrio sp. Nv17 TaxID=1855339 RepID=UPI00093169EC|nr:POTRA domain-containing protein [Nitrosovibrio sp. Nv17]
MTNRVARWWQIGGFMCLAALWLPLVHAQEAETVSEETEAGPQDVAPQEAEASQPQEAEEARFDVFEYRVQGTTLLPTGAVEQAVYPYLGEDKSLQVVEQARDALERAYHDAGYLTVLVSIPQQKVEAGVVRLAVTEAAVKRLRVVDARYFSPADIKAAVPELAEGKVPNFSTMQQQLSTLNRTADRGVTPVLRAGKTPGTVEVDLKVKDQLPLHGSIELNSRQIPNTTLTRLSASLSWDNLWHRQHSLGVTGLITPENPDESKVISGNYTMPGILGGFLALYSVYSASDVASVGTLNVLGNGLIVGGRYILPLPGGQGFFHTATLGVDYKDFGQTVNLQGGGRFNTPITYLPFTVGWDGTWLGEGRTTKLGLSVNFHVRGLVGSETEFANKRFKGHSNYIYLRGNLAHTETFPQGWGVHGRASWQVAAQPLINNEQSILGGVSTVRGYYEVAALADDSIAGGLEVFTPNYAKHLTSLLTEFHLLAFVDAGHARVLEPLPGQIDHYTLLGTGAGLRLKGRHGTSAEFSWAVALEDAGRTRAGDKRVHFVVRQVW